MVDRTESIVYPSEPVWLVHHAERFTGSGHRPADERQPSAIVCVIEMKEDGKS